MKELKDLPIGVQTFKKMRENNYVYVDKTAHIYDLTRQQGAYFLSRPRRFGKSLTISTFKELFEGNRALFNGLWIEDKWDWSKKHPVIHLSFAQAGYKTLGLEEAIVYELQELGKQFDIMLSTHGFSLQFRELIQKLYEKHGSVVILIDEYDKPMLDYLEKGKLEQAKENQNILKTFYSVLKDAEDYLQFLFITGVSKFAKVSIFSDLNHLSDLTLNQDYATLVGYTQDELESNFDDYIDFTVEELSLNRVDLLAQMKTWYDGFSWDGKQFLYNPFGILNFFNSRAFRNYWFATGTPTFLVKLMKEKGVYEFEARYVTDSFLEKANLDNLEIVSVMFQTGYLTVKELDVMTGEMLLDYPNKEVRDSMYQFLLDDMAKMPQEGTAQMTVKNLSKAFAGNNLDIVKLIINTLFSDLPAQLYQGNKAENALDKKRELALSERFFHSIIHLIFKYLGVFIDSEVSTSMGRADSVVQTATHIYIFEFKYNRSGKAAMTQLEKNNYADKCRLSNKKIIGIGVNFSHLSRQINGWTVKELN
jgi:Predicted AAA-ATPase/PD-(D/E)XK nuclease superfamily